MSDTRDKVIAWLIIALLTTWLMGSLIVKDGAFWRCGVLEPMVQTERTKKICEQRIEYFQRYLDAANFVLERKATKEAKDD